MSRKQVAIRTDASLRIGSGHVMRCLTLANGLRESGAEVTFITREHEGHLASLIESRGFACRRLAVPSAKAHIAGLQSDEHSGWLGCTQDEDVLDSLASLSVIGCVDWLVVDHYGIDIHWEHQVRHGVQRIMVIDDLADRAHGCDLLLDQNFYTDINTRYQRFVPERCTSLLGPRYALLTSDFARGRWQATARQAVAPFRVLVFFGGVDATNETGKFLDAWSNVARSDLFADVVIGGGNKRADVLIRKAATVPRVKIHRHVKMADLMFQADYAFGAAGITTWERFSAGLNSTITSVAENQSKIACDLSTLDLIDYLGDWKDVDVASYTQALIKLQPTEERLLQRSRRIADLVDGDGVRRVVSRMIDKWEGEIAKKSETH